MAGSGGVSEMRAVGVPFKVSHASGLNAVNRVLGEMHGETLRLGGIEGGSVRLSVLNIVAACVDTDSADLAGGGPARRPPPGARHHHRR
jgi:hypothetical protein